MRIHRLRRLAVGLVLCLLAPLTQAAGEEARGLTLRKIRESGLITIGYRVGRAKRRHPA